MEYLAWAYLSVCFLCSAIMVVHEAAGHGEKMFIMNVVWPITALYWGPAALWFYFHEQRRNEVAVAVSHCGAGCVLGDIAGELAVSLGGWTFAGNEFLTRLVIDFVLAWIFGIVFQYFSIVPMRHVSPREGIFLAVRADTFSIVAFQIGMSCWMALDHFVLFPHMRMEGAVFWFMMQIAMMIGFFASYPANVFLLKVGWKERMS